MKLKHFAGYGSVQATKVWNGENDGFRKIRICVAGNHERGLIPYYYDTGIVKRWLLNRFDREVKDISESNMYIEYSVDSSYVVIDGKVTETAMYDIEYQCRNFPLSYKKFTL